MSRTAGRQIMNDETSFSDLCAAEVGRIEQFARRLLELQWTSAPDLWRLELDLVNYQVALQDEVARERRRLADLKAHIRRAVDARADGWKEQVCAQQLKRSEVRDRERLYTYFHALSRRVGDALAWLVLGGEEIHFLPLTENKPTPFLPTGPSLQAMLAIAERLADAGAGFPLIHDMTSALRVGDVTFIVPGEAPLTVEIKSHEAGRQGNLLRLNTDVLSAGHERWTSIDAHLPNGRRPDSAERAGSAEPRTRRLPPQWERQLERMRRARRLQTATPGDVVSDADGDTHIMRFQADSTTYHWTVVQNLAAEAKSNGYASRVVDGAMLYAAVYADPSAEMSLMGDLSQVALEHMRDDLTASGMLMSETEQNVVNIGGSPLWLAGKTPPYARPFLTFPLPTDALVDVLWGRLVLVVVINLGRVAEALRGRGLDARAPGGDREWRELFVPTSLDVRASDGTRLRATISSGPLRSKLLNEFLSIGAFADAVARIADEASARAAQEIGGVAEG